MARTLQMLVARERVHPVEALLGSAACVVLPTLARLALTAPLGSALPFATYFPTVLLATLLWGSRWGAAVLAASGLIAGFLFVQSTQITPTDPKGFAALGLFLVVGALILFTGQALRRALIGLQAARTADAARKRELQHRLKNTLAIVQSFSFYLSRKTTDTALYHRLLEERISALAKASEVLFAEEYENCALPDTAVAAMAPFADDERMSLSGPSLVLDASSCEPLVLALHELATNAHKHGSLSVPLGRVELSWKVARTDPSKCVIRWVEKNGPIVHAPVRSGLGQRLLARQRGLDAVDIRYDATGLICELLVPLGQSGARPRRRNRE